MVGMRSADFGGVAITDRSATGGGLITPPESRSSLDVTPPSCGLAVGGSVFTCCCLASSRTCSRQVAAADQAQVTRALASAIAATGLIDFARLVARAMG